MTSKNNNYGVAGKLTGKSFVNLFGVVGSIFRETSYNFLSAGALMQLPIPLSVFACYGGIVLLGGFARA